MLSIIPLKENELEEYRSEHALSPDAVVFRADDGENALYPALRMDGKRVEIIALTGDDFTDELFIRSAASYGEYRFADTLVMKTGCKKEMLERVGFDMSGEYPSIEISKIVHYH